MVDFLETIQEFVDRYYEKEKQENLNVLKLICLEEEFE
jgi:hypothetical protein